MLSTSQLRRWWAPACKFDGVIVTLNGGARIYVDRRTVPAWQAFNAILIRWGYVCYRDQTGAFNCRRITGGTGYSLHAFGIAADVNWRTNPYGPVLITDMPAGMVAEVLALRTGNGLQVFGWGGLYRRSKDAMHWEVVCKPSDLATGIVNYRPKPPTTTTPKGWDEMATKAEIQQAVRDEIKRANIPTITTMQTVNALFGNPADPTDDYGAEGTEKRLKEISNGILAFTTAVDKHGVDRVLAALDKIDK